MTAKRKWSAAGAANSLDAAFALIQMGPHEQDDLQRCAEKHLVKARLDAIKDCISICDERGHMGAEASLLDFLATEQARLNPKRARAKP